MKDGPVDIGSRRELFVDECLVDQLEGGAELHLHKPRGREVVLVNDRPWESSSAYFSVFLDGDTYRMYYRGFHHGAGGEARGEPMCYAESKDGIHWAKPDLGLFAYEGSTQNNIVLGGDRGKFPASGKWSGCLGTDHGWRGDMVPFKDANPAAEPDASYKALVRGCRGTCQVAEGRRDYGMYPFKSPDGIHWTAMSEKPVITKGRFDSQNLAFWDDVHGRYVAFVRDIRGICPRTGRFASDPEDVAGGSHREIRMCVSNDFVNWSEPVFVEYEGAEPKDLYTNAVLPYERAPHLLLGFPTEMLLTFSDCQTQPVFMVSRDGGRSFRLWAEPLIPPTAPEGRDGNRGNYMARGLVRGNDREYFVYATEGYGEDEPVRLRRFTYRVDGFVSVRSPQPRSWVAAGIPTGAVVTPPLLFSGNRLVVNYAAWGGGSLRVQLEDIGGNPLDGLSLDDCTELCEDAIDQQVTWKTGADPGRYSGQPVRLRFALRHADLFSFRFAE